jgi:hypothetical protein
MPTLPPGPGKGSDTCANSIFYMRKRLFGLPPSAGKSARSSNVVRGAVAETRVATQKAIAVSRESMAEADAVIARGYRRQAKDLRVLVRAANMDDEMMRAVAATHGKLAQRLEQLAV